MRTIKERLKKMADVYLETSGGLYDAFSIRFFADGSGRVLDGADNEIVEFISLVNFLDVTDLWILDQYPDETVPHFYDDMPAMEIEKHLARELARIIGDGVVLLDKFSSVIAENDTIIIELNGDRYIHIDLFVGEPLTHGC